MCKIVYLTSRRFDKPSKKFKKALETELKSRNVEVVTDTAFDIFNCFKKHKTFGIAIAFDFYRDGKAGCGLTLNENCTYIGRDLAYSISNEYDALLPLISWRDFKFVNSYDLLWYKFFNKVSSSTKAIFHLCTYNNDSDRENFLIYFDEIVKIFADEIVRCLRSNYDSVSYRQRVKIARNNIQKKKKRDGMD